MATGGRNELSRARDDDDARATREIELATLARDDDDDGERRRRRAGARSTRGGRGTSLARDDGGVRVRGGDVLRGPLEHFDRDRRDEGWVRVG